MENSVLIIQERIAHYRFPLFDSLALVNKITVAGDRIDFGKQNFNSVLFKKITFFGLYWHRGLIKHVLENDYSRIICVANPRCITLVILFFLLKSRVCWTWWGLDKGKSTVANGLRKLVFRGAWGYIFYSPEQKQSFSSVTNGATWVSCARNSIRCAKRSAAGFQRKWLLNVGSLDGRKRNFELIDIFEDLAQSLPFELSLVFVGDGPLRTQLMEYAATKRHSELIKFFDHIDLLDERLSEIYARSLCSVSVGQAGLSILSSFAHGVPFFTLKDAISGGEIFSIQHKVNGYLSSSRTDLTAALKSYLLSKKSQTEMQANALNYYREEASFESFVSQFQDSINQ